MQADRSRETRRDVEVGVEGNFSCRLLPGQNCRVWRLALVLLLGALLGASTCRGARANTYSVTNTNDSGNGSLRKAMTDANNNAGADTISISATGTINLLSALPSISGAVDINGPGADRLTVRRNVSTSFQIFATSVAAPAAVTLSGVTISNGRSSDLQDPGAGVRLTGTGTLNITNCAVSGNVNNTDGGGIALSSSGTINVTSSTISGNSAVTGGGIYLIGGGTVNVTNSTISGNSAVTGGGIFNEMSGVVNVSSSTITENSATDAAGVSGGIVNFSNGFITLKNSIAALNTRSGSASDLGGTIASQGYNVIGTTSGATFAPTTGDQTPVTSTQLKLGTFGLNGGTTQNYPLQTGSVAIDKGKAFGATTDQRGLTRPSDDASIAPASGGDNSDIGAFEVQVPTVTAPTVTTPTSTNITATGARLGGNVTSDNGSAITERGVVYAPTGVDADPNIGDAGVTKVAASTATTGVFTVAVTGLSSSTGYSFKAYATSANGTGYTSAATFTTANAAPVLGGASTTLSYTEGDAATPITNTLTVSDVDSANLSSATVAITSNFVANEDKLEFTNQNNITGNYNGTTGELALSGQATPAQYQTALNSVKYFNANDRDPSTSNRTVSFVVNDSSDPSNTVTRTISVATVNDAPVIGALSGPVSTIAGRAAIVIDSDATVTDVDNTNFNLGALRVSLSLADALDVLAIRNQGTVANQISVTGSDVFYEGTRIGTFSGGTNNAILVVSLNASATRDAVEALVRNITFRTTSTDTTDRTATFTLSDGSGGTVTTANTSAPATKTITVAQNQVPSVTLSGTATPFTEGGAPVLLDDAAVVEDADSLDLDGGILTIDFSAGATADDRLTIRNQGTGAGQIGVTGSTVTFGVTAIGTFAGGTGTTALVISFNDQATPSNVQVLLRNILFSNLSDNPPTASRNVRVVLTDGDGGTSAPTTKAVAITAVNDAPVITAPATIGVTEDVASPLVGLSFSDPDASANAVEVTLSVPAGSGTLQSTSGAGVTITGSGTRLLTLTGSISDLNAFIAASKVIFTTASNATADVVLSVGISDQGNSGGAAQTDTATVTLQVLAVNDAPTLVDPADVNINEDAGPQTVNLSGITAGGGESQALTVTANSDNPTLIPNPTVTYTSPSATGTLRFTPAADRSGTAIITVTVMDNGGVANGGVDTFSQQFTVTVAAENDVPVLSGIESTTLAFVENDAATPISTAIVVADVDSPQLAGATVAITSNFAAGEDVLGFTNQNGISGAFNATSGVLTLSGTATVAQYQAALRSVTFGNTSENPSTSPRTITFTVRDSGGASNPQTRTVSVARVNDAPVAQSAPVQTPEDTPLLITLGGTDVDGDTLTFEIVSGPNNGTLSSGAGAARTYTPNANFVGTDSFTFRVNDGTVNSATATITITVGGTNDAPVAVDDSAEAAFGTPITLQVLANDTDADNDALIVLNVDTTNTRGTVTISADGKSVVFTPASGFSGNTSFGYTVSDGTATATARVTVQVLANPTPANRAPVAVADSYNVSAFTPRTLQVLAPGVLQNDTDADGNTLLAALVDSPRSGKLLLNPNGSFTYTPGALFSGSDTFTYSAFDGQAYSAPARVTLVVPATRDTTPPLVSLAGPAVRRLPLLPLARGSAVDPYATRERGIVPTSGLRSVVLRLQNGQGLFWNGRGFQSAPFDLRTRLIERSFFAMDAALPPRKAASSPDERFIYTAVATDNANNKSTAQQFILVDTTPPGLAITTPGAGINNTVRVSRLTSIGGRASSAAKVEVSLRNSAGLFFDGTSFVNRVVFLRASLSGVNYTLSLPANLNLAPGSYLISVRALDEAANIASASRTVIVQSSVAR